MRPRTGCDRLILGLLALGLLAGIALTDGPAQAASGLGPFYAEPAWDQKIAPDTRFLVLTNWDRAAVLDKETGLVWEKSPATTRLTWSEARFQCTSRTTGNRKGWRLPSIHELASLVHPAQQNLALPLGHPFTNFQLTGFNGYWSATTLADFPTHAWGVDFFNGSVNGFDKSVVFIPAWCVRGGMNADAY